MAARTQGSVIGYVVSLILFVVLFLVSLVLAIMFHSQAAKAEADRLLAEKSLRNVAAPTDLTGEDFAAARRDAGAQSVTRYLLDETAKAKNLLWGDKQATIDSMQKTMGEELKIPAGETLLSATRRLQSNLVAANAAIKGFEDNSKAANDRAAAAAKDRDTLQQAYAKDRTDWQAKLDAQKKELDAFRAGIGGDFDKLGKDIAAAQKDAADKLAAKDVEVVQLKAQVKQLEDKLNSLAHEGARPDQGLDMANRADGTIVAADPGSPTVSINRGLRQHVILGMTFEVYDDVTQIKRDPKGREMDRGKAAIEVTRVMDDAAECRIVRLEPTQTVKVGDVIANVVYDPNITYRFYVFGDFDLTGTGQPSEGERNTVRTLIKEWGGKPVDELTYDVDFVVLGIEPETPRKPPEAGSPDYQAKLDEYQRAQAKLKAYQEVLDQAAKLRIAVLNQNRFLWMTGYYDRVPGGAKALPR